MSRRSSGGNDVGAYLVMFAAALAGVVLFAGAVAIWWLHRLVAWGVLLLTRDTVVHLFGDDFGEVAETVAIICWRMIVPGLLFMAAYRYVEILLVRPRDPFHWLIVLALSAGAGCLCLYHYFRLYTQEPPRHPSWPKFVAADIRLRTMLKLRWIEEKLRWRL